MKLTTSEKEKVFIENARIKHKDKYDYSKVKYVNNHTKVCIICPEHGEFWQTPSSHLHGCGCPKCGRLRTIKSKTNNVSNFIAKSVTIHGNKYDYSKVEYTNNSTKVCIICPEHGEFWQTPRSHLQGKGCPLCANKKISNSRHSNTELFIKKSKQIHGNFYDYHKTMYIDCHHKVCIICPKHGEFWQVASYHLSGRGCPICAKEKISLKQKRSKEEFIKLAKQVHGNKYDYSKVNYVNCKTKVCIICPEHGEFWQTPDDHLRGKGCPNCNLIRSKAETEIINILKPLNCEQGNRAILEGKEIDVYIPSLKLGIEYNGLWWHSEAFGKNKYYHLNKLEECKRKGIKLIQIFEDEWINHKNICENKLKYICNLNKTQTIKENEYSIQQVTNKQDVCDFLETYSLQGKIKFSVCIGVYDKNNLIGLMTFKRLKENNWKINGIAVNFNYTIDKFKENILSYFMNQYKPHNITITLDRRWDDDKEIYNKLGFRLSSIISPKCYYHNKKEKYKRYSSKPLNNEEYTKIWDCGFLELTYNNLLNVE